MLRQISFASAGAAPASLHLRLPQSSVVRHSSLLPSMDQRRRTHIQCKQTIAIDSNQVQTLLSDFTLTKHLQFSLSSSSIACPQRINFPIDEDETGHCPSATLLLMPSWSQSQEMPYIGLKIVTAHPQNTSIGIPGINASYILSDRFTGKPLAYIDGGELTHWRTSCLSALASSYLSRDNSSVLAMIGAGQLAPYLIRAHLSERPSLRKVIVWNRTPSKALALVEELRGKLGAVEIEFGGSDIDAIVSSSDIVCCATGSKEPLVNGKVLRAGTHLDLVGSFSPSMRECDDAALLRSSKVFVDWKGALDEAGELVEAFSRGVFKPKDVAGTLVELVNGSKKGRTDLDEITVFKSVGSATVDLLAAQFVYERFCKSMAK
eukprot:TRINITY_DN1095_c0_g1_i1.p1 TRINITY_DN1095_c0_g1~~TRINITY_DN1095_c0_g1_i1.p1  ORF type:complete len:377 (-),score=68.18 TRINITY_DN1095_c0_g1_i1:607-1737(-)